MTSFDMNKEKIEILIKKRIEQNFPNCEFTIENVSHKHKKHPQNIKGSETHFIISLESDKFFKLSILDRQRYLINILGKNYKCEVICESPYDPENKKLTAKANPSRQLK